MPKANFENPLIQRDIRSDTFYPALHSRHERWWPTNKIIPSFAILFCFCFAQATGPPVEPRPVPLKEDGQGFVKHVLRGMSLKQKVGQMLQVRAYLDYPSFESPSYQYVRGELQKYGIGSVVLGMHFNRLGAVRNSPQDAVRVSNQLQNDSRLPSSLLPTSSGGSPLA